MLLYFIILACHKAQRYFQKKYLKSLDKDEDVVDPNCEDKKRNHFDYDESRRDLHEAEEPDARRNGQKDDQNSRKSERNLHVHLKTNVGTIFGQLS